MKLTAFNRRDNRVTRIQLREAIERDFRDPFKDVLAELLQCRPTPTAMFVFAQEHPDKWSNAVHIMARLAGYRDEVVIDHTGLRPEQMGDAELLQRLKELRDTMGLVQPLPSMLPAGITSNATVQQLNAAAVTIDQPPAPAQARKKSIKKGGKKPPS